MKAKEYQLMERMVELGLRTGWSRAHKHTDKPSHDALIQALLDAVMLEISDAFTFEGEYEE